MNETMAGLIVLCFSVLIVYLLWRVWRLENRVDSGELHNMTQYVARSEMNWAMCEERRFGTSVAERLSALARALGYEWKRTDAKEGWERKPDPYAIDLAAAAAPFRAYNEKRYADALWDRWGENRRKADRRKVVGSPYAAMSCAAERRMPAPQAAPKSPPKKRRAH